MANIFDHCDECINFEKSETNVTCGYCTKHKVGKNTFGKACDDFIDLDGNKATEEILTLEELLGGKGDD